jgi:hypothetical protein
LAMILKEGMRVVFSGWRAEFVVSAWRENKRFSRRNYTDRSVAVPGEVASSNLSRDIRRPARHWTVANQVMAAVILTAFRALLSLGRCRLCVCLRRLWANILRFWAAGGYCLPRTANRLALTRLSL